VPINLGDQFEADVAHLAGFTSYDSGSLDIPFLNPDGATTVRFTVSVNVDTAALKAKISERTA
jgi:hypothetical protein